MEKFIKRISDKLISFTVITLLMFFMWTIEDIEQVKLIGTLFAVVSLIWLFIMHIQRQVMDCMMDKLVETGKVERD